MTTTGEQIELRDPYANAYDPASERSAPAQLHGAPRRQRERRALASGAALVAIPLLVMGAIGSVVIDGYRDAPATRSSATGPLPSAPDAHPGAAPGAEADGQAPTGPDVGTDGLNPAVTRAITRAREAALAQGITIDIVSGYRTNATPQQLFDPAATKYGSRAAAPRWVLPPDKSAHVTGAAIDVGPYAAAQWLEKNGVSFGLCRRYANEYWHFELLAPAKGQPCPALEANAASSG